ncbi:MAG: hypothetical protein OEO18_17685, partial [Gammaproteobacteria bacterium]|nr:hypothetical protein [Gammaproteobacteria bacterium]
TGIHNPMPETISEQASVYSSPTPENHVAGRAIFWLHGDILFAYRRLALKILVTFSYLPSPAVLEVRG